MDNPIVQLPLDLTGTNPNNHVGNEHHLLVALDGFPYKIITLFHGGFYTKGLKIYDINYNELIHGLDYIFTYRHQQVSDRTGLDVCSAIVFLRGAAGTVITSAQMVGGDLAFSFNVVQDYLTFFHTKPSGYVPRQFDYNGTEPSWGPGELVQERWGLDTYQPFNNELETIYRRLMIGDDNDEENLRKTIRDRLDVFLANFNNRLQQHIDNKANPHGTTADKLGLGLVRNLPVATAAEALALGSNDAYMTPKLAWAVSDTWAAAPLNDHTNLTASNPHGVTPAQMNSHPWQAVTANIESKQLKGSTINNTRYMLYQGTWHSYEEYVAKLRKNLSASYFPNGMLQPAKMGAGPLEATAVMRGDRRWSRVSDILAEYVTTPAASFNAIVVNTYDPNVAMNMVRATWPYEPVGSTVFARCLVTVQQGWGNGETQFDVNQDYAFVMTPSGWVMA